MKILLCTMSLNRGGAETHVLELARALKEKGNEVLLASDGGEIANELIGEGFSHITLPLGSRSPAAMAKCFFAIRKLAKKEKFDIVHAHARIPGFICERVRRSLDLRERFRLVLTCHGTYAVTPILRALSCWGEKTLAVSRDVREYLIDNYDVCADNISLTVNGIDCRRFCPKGEEAREDARRKFNISPDAKVIAHVSRLECDTSLAAHALIAAAPSVVREFPGAVVLIVGDGGDFASLAKEARAANAALGYQAVKLTGSRADIEFVLGEADIFVGVSRAALEAMALDLPVILAGAQGSLGILSREKLERAKKTNFTCRGEALPEADALANDIVTLLRRRALDIGEAREIVIKEYSIEKMCADALGVYSSLLANKIKKKTDVLLVGYYGSKNAGDDAVMRACAGRILENNDDLCVCAVSAHPRRTERESGLRAVSRYDLFAIRKAIRGCRAVVFGGGSLLQDSTSLRSLRYYTAILSYAQKKGKKTYLYANGMGPIKTSRGRALCRKVLPKIDFATLRDSRSRELFLSLGGENCKVSADAAFERKDYSGDLAYDCRERLGIAKEKYFVVAARELDGKDEEKLERSLLSLCVERRTVGEVPVFAVFQHSHDYKLARKLADLCGGTVADNFGFSELCALEGDACFTIGMRYHSIVASAGKCPTIALSYDPKVSNLASDLFIPCIDAHSLDADELCRSVRALDGVSAVTAEKVEEMKRAAREDFAEKLS